MADLESGPRLADLEAIQTLLLDDPTVCGLWTREGMAHLSVMGDVGPTLVEDEAKLKEYADGLVEAFAEIALPWLQRLVDSRAPGMGAMPPVVAQLQTGADQTVSALRDLLALDIADQPTGPLEILRAAVRHSSEVLARAEVSPVERDSFAIKTFPDDQYGLTPASFGDVDPSLHEPGLMWGAAKAHVHLRRRRDAPVKNMSAGQPPPSGSAAQGSVVPGSGAPGSGAPGSSSKEESTEESVVVLSVDLMDRSKISSAYPEATLVRSVAKLIESAAGADLVVVDLGRLDDPSVLSDLTARVVAFGSHVNSEALEAASAAGAEALPRSVFFRRLETGAV